MKRLTLDMLQALADAYVPTEPGIGTCVPEALWEEARERLLGYSGLIQDTRKEATAREFLIPPPIAIRLTSGDVIKHVIVHWDREIVHRGTNLRGPEWMTEGLDFTEDEIEAIGVPILYLGGLFGRMKWFER